MRKTAILAGLMLLAGTVASAAVSVTVQSTSLVTSPMTASASSSPIGLFKFALAGDAGETLSSVTVTLTANGSSTVTGSDLASLAVYKDANANNAFDAGTDLVAGTQTSVNVGTPTTITTSANNDLGAGNVFFVALSTGSTWGSSSPLDSLTATIATDGIATSANSPTVTAVTTDVITAALTTPALSTAVAANTAGTETVVLSFDSATNKPTIDATNINATLALNNGHSWLDGNGQVGSAVWSADGKTLMITLTSNISVPTVTAGDTVSVGGSVIRDVTGTNNATGSVSITGSLVAATTPTLGTAVASNTGNNDGIGAGDTVVLSFASVTNKPAIDATNIDTVLALANSHSWKDGAGAIGSAVWNSTGTVLTITLSAATSAPTVTVGDTLTISGSTIKDSTATNNATGTAVISGSFSGSTSTSGEGDEGEGHGCTNTLINGRLYKLDGDANPTVYLAANCILKPFRGEAVFHARGNKFNNIITLTSLTGFTVSDMPALPAGGTLVKGSDKTVWFVNSHQQRQGFTSETVFKGLGFNFGQVNQISDSDLNTMPVSTPINTDTTHPDGALVKCGNSATVFQIISGQEQAFTNLESFILRGHTFTQVADIDCGAFHYVLGLQIQ